MGLSAIRFQGDPRLEQVERNSPAMRKGEVGHPVRLIQQALLDLNYPMPISTAEYGTPDGIYGNETKSRVYEFQVDHKLKDRDGVVGHDTITKLDALLYGKPWSVLPPLPIDTPSSWATELVVETLGSQILNGLSFAIDGVRIEARQFDQVLEAVEEGRIGIEIDPAIHGALEYDPTGDVFRFSSTPRATIFHRTSIVHEAVHAVCDIRGKAMDYIFSEMLAFVGAAYYYRRITAKRQQTGGAPPDPVDDVFRTADAIAHKLVHAELIDSSEVRALRRALEAPGSGYSGKVGLNVAYDGIPA